MADNPGGDTPHQEPLQPAFAFAAHDNELGADTIGGGENLGINRGAGLQADLQVQALLGGFPLLALQVLPGAPFPQFEKLLAHRGDHAQGVRLGVFIIRKILQGVEEEDVAPAGPGQVQGRVHGPLAGGGIVGAHQDFFQGKGAGKGGRHKNSPVAEKLAHG